MNSIRQGVVFTPDKWAEWALEISGTLESVEDGKTLCDPTGGEGGFILALCRLAVKKRGALDPDFLKRLFVVEIEPTFLEGFRRGFQKEFGRVFPPENLICTDIVLANPELQFDLLVGNPPWVNFSDLPEESKQLLKKEFVRFGLVRDRRNVLLGGSRVDLSALILSVVFAKNLKAGGRAGFFLPLSLFFNEGAHENFRRTLDERKVRLKALYDFKGISAFPEVKTRFCFAQFAVEDFRPSQTPFFSYESQRWVETSATPVGDFFSPLSISAQNTIPAPPLIQIDRTQMPRQGSNTCGANTVFHFEEIPDSLPSEFFYPLVTSEALEWEEASVKKYILLPYSFDGKVLSWEALVKAGLDGYFANHRNKLEARRGALIGGPIARGYWWSLLGIGPYSFAPWKVVWKAMGSRTFQPRILGGWQGKPWQPNQAMHAFIPCSTKEDAERLCRQLSESRIEERLKAQRMDGTRSWAQPGSIKRFLEIL